MYILNIEDFFFSFLYFSAEKAVSSNEAKRHITYQVIQLKCLYVDFSIKKLFKKNYSFDIE